jgi:hypothetical protein
MLSVPGHLRDAGRTFFAAVATEYSLDDPAGLALLSTAAECLDRMRAAQASIAERGELVDDRYGAPKLNPACGLEKDARAGFLAAMRALNLDLEPLRDGTGRPPNA